MNAMQTQTLLVAGGTGYIGQHVVRELKARGHRVLALARPRAGIGGAWDPSETQARMPGVQWAFGEVTDAQFVQEAFPEESIDGVVSCLASRNGAPEDAWAVDCQANRNLLQRAQRSGARQFILLSAICVQKPRLAFQHAKLAFERELVNSEMTHSIVRPTAFFKSLAGQVARVRDGRPYLMFGDGTATACKPISERDLARFMADCLEDPEKQNAVLPIGGPGPAWTPKAQGELLFSLTGKPPRYQRIPLWLFSTIVKVLGLAARIVPSLRPKAEFARIGAYYATESMLVWDPKTGKYDANATPSFGSDTLESFYRTAIQQENPAAPLGDHAVFS